MSYQWTLLGPKVPVPVYRSHLLRATGLSSTEEGIQWEVMPNDPAAWAPLDARKLPDDARTLLLVHGTGQRTRPGFMGFTPEEFERLQARYAGRVLAFEHRAFAHHLDRNARDLCRALVRGGVPLRLDVLGLSRGGLVTRYLAEGWADALIGDQIQIDKLIFIGTPNGGTPSARWDLPGSGAREMKAWRTDVRRVALVNQRERDVALIDDPHGIEGFDPDSLSMRGWPMLLGSQDQLPNSRVLKILNGFAGAAPGRSHRPTYFGIASIFDFEHGAPDAQLLGGARPYRRSEITRWALPVPNDLVVPTASVYAPLQGAHASGLFPLVSERLMVLAPSSNATHVGLLRLRAVRERILRWLGL